MRLGYKMSSFRRKKRFILRDTEKEIYFPPGFEHSIHGLRGEISTAGLSDLLMNGHKEAYNKYQILICLQINQVYAIVTK